jgi:serine/threonine-protein kinase
LALPVLTPDERLGTRLSDRYELRRIAGQGASAVLYAAHDHLLSRDVAVKVMKPQGALSGSGERERFRREAQTLARLRHPHLVEVYDVGDTDDDVPCVVMELLEGETLAARLEREGCIAIEGLLALMLPLMGALCRAHDVGVVHRDVKPANIFLAQRSSGHLVPKLLDFGIAKAEHHSGITSTGLALGTPAYMAPEQARGEELGPQTDVWAMGVTLYRCLTGRLPFEATTAAGVLWEATRNGAPRIRELCPALDPAVALVIERALEPDLTRRHASIQALAESLVRVAKRAGLKLPPAPDPQGLPHYAAWLADTELEQGTEPQPILVRPASQVAFVEGRGDSQRSKITTTEDRRPWGRWRWPALGAVMAFGLLAWVFWGDAEPSRASRPAPVAEAERAEPESARAAALPITSHEATLVERAPAPDVSAVASNDAGPQAVEPVASPPKVDRVPTRAPVRKRASVQKRPSHEVKPDTAVAPPPAKQGVVTQWDW